MLSTVCGMSERFNNSDSHFFSSCPLPLTMVQRQDIALANYQSYATGTSWVTYTRALICHSLAEEIMTIPISQIRKLKFRAALGFGLQGLCLPHSTWTLTFSILMVLTHLGASVCFEERLLRQWSRAGSPHKNLGHQGLPPAPRLQFLHKGPWLN